MLDDYKEKQPIIYKILNNSLTCDKVSHAYLFDISNTNYGLDFINAFIKSIICPLHNTFLGKCNKDCNLCKTIDDKNYPDISYIDADGLWIKKDQLLDLQVKFNTKSLYNNKKIYIINGAEFLNSSSANSILKFLEEPEPNIIAILLTNNVDLVMKTIVSRCQVLHFLPNLNNCDESLINKIGTYLYNSSNEINNFVNDPESLNLINNIIDYVDFYEQNRKEILLYSKSKWFILYKDKISNIFAYNVMQLLYKDIINYKIGRNVEFFNDYINIIDKIVQKNTLDKLYKKLLIIINAMDRVKMNVNLSLNLDNMIIEMEKIK